MPPSITRDLARTLKRGTVLDLGRLKVARTERGNRFGVYPGTEGWADYYPDAETAIATAMSRSRR